MKRNFKIAMQLIGFHGLVLLRGLAKVLYGAAVAGLIGLAVYGFSAIPYEGGYVAVLDFIGAIATLTVALACMYAFGGRNMKKGRYASNG